MLSLELDFSKNLKDSSRYFCSKRIGLFDVNAKQLLKRWVAHEKEVTKVCSEVVIFLTERCISFLV